MIDVIIVAGGRGRRFGAKKQWAPLKGKPVVAYSLETFDAHPLVNSILLGVPEGDIALGKEVLENYAPTKGRGVFVGGDERYETVKNGLSLVDADFVAIHDAVRPFVSASLLDRLFSALEGTHFWGVIPVVDINDTVKVVDQEVVKGTLDRSVLKLVQTPQLFKTEKLKFAYDSLEDFTGITDDSSVVERVGGEVVAVEGDLDNFKITRKEDLKRAAKMLYSFRVGFGYDIHRVGEGEVLYLGGVPIEAGFSLVGHSDADVLIHALVDAIVGALGEGDIGEWFPDNDERFKGASSVYFLSRVVERLRDLGYELLSADVTVVAQRPRLSPYKGRIRESLAAILSVSKERINVKAKTKEGLDAVGRGEAVEAYAVVMLG